MTATYLNQTRLSNRERIYIYISDSENALMLLDPVFLPPARVKDMISSDACWVLRMFCFALAPPIRRRGAFSRSPVCTESCYDFSSSPEFM